jgi:hypothetical protein
MRRQIAHIIGDVIGAIDKTIRIDSVVDVGMSDKLFVCEFKWLKVGDVVIHAPGETATVSQIGENYIIVANNSSFDWTNSFLTIDTNFTYVYGTRDSVNAEWLQLSRNEDDKLPLFVLVVPTREDDHVAKSGLDRESSIVMYVCQRFTSGQTVTEIYDTVIAEIWHYVIAFLGQIDNDYSFKMLEDYKSRELPFFGDETKDSFESVIVDSLLSAIELRFTLPIRKGAKICLC